MLVNEKIILVERPSKGPEPSNFEMVREPVGEPGNGQVLLEIQWISIEPYMLLGMKGSAPHTRSADVDRLADLANHYLGGVEIGATMYGPTIARVAASRHPGFAVDDMVVSYSGWQHFALDDGTNLLKIPPGEENPTAWLGVLGIPGLTAYAGMTLIGQPKPGETVVVSAALGAVGSVVGQLARIAGARAVGIASGPHKTRMLVDEIGFDAAVDRLDPDFPRLLAEACPKGVDVYFENAGGAVWWAVMPLLNEFARVPVCGLAAQYAQYAQLAGGTGPDRTMDVFERLMLFRQRIQGLFVFDHGELEPQFRRDMTAWIDTGKIRYVEEKVEGLGSAPQALIGVLSGKNNGKMLVRP